MSFQDLDKQADEARREIEKGRKDAQTPKDQGPPPGRKTLPDQRKHISPPLKDQTKHRKGA